MSRKVDPLAGLVLQVGTELAAWIRWAWRNCVGAHTLR